MIHERIDHALTYAVAQAPCGIAYRKSKGWVVYDLRDGCTKGDEPEFLVIKQGVVPLPLSDTAFDVWVSFLNARISEIAKKPARCVCQLGIAVCRPAVCRYGNAYDPALAK